MEKFYIVSPECFLHKEYLDYETSTDAANRLYQQFSKDIGIKSNLYYADNSSLAIVPTHEDKEKFCAQLKKYADGETGLVFFKKNAMVLKAWIELLHKNELKITRKPFVSFKLGILGKCSTRIFQHNGVVYMSIDADRDFDDPKGCKQIRGSEFYKIIEECEESENRNK